MPRRTRPSYAQTDFRGGICLEPENAQPNQVLDALNVWAPDSKLIKRPGSAPVFYPYSGDWGNGGWGWRNAGTLSARASHVAPATFASTSPITIANDTQRIYVGFEAGSDPISQLIGFTGPGDAATTSEEPFFCEYWNGTEWRPCWHEDVWDKESDSTNATAGYYTRTYVTGAGFLNKPTVATGDITAVQLLVIPGADWETSIAGTDWDAEGWPTVTTTSSATIDSTARYYLRFTSVNGSGFVGNSTTFGSGTVQHVRDNSDYQKCCRGAAQLQFASGTVVALLYRSLNGVTAGSGAKYTALDFFVGPSLKFQNHDQDFYEISTPDLEPGTFAVIPEFDLAYFAYANQLFEIKLNDPPTVTPATVNTSDIFIGSGAPFDSSVVSLLNAPPQARYVKNFKGVVFVAGLALNPFVIRWSGNILQGGYNVWPTNNFENVSEDDNSPIVGLASVGEHLAVYKRDSIWIMVFSGTAQDTGQPIFSPTKVVAGRGAVANSSIQEVGGQNIFLSEDGFFRFDGTPNIAPLSENIDEMIRRITWSRVEFGASVYWKTRKCYLFSCSIDGAANNNFVFVYDVARDAWWFWDDINVEQWLLLEDGDDIETLHYVDNFGRVFRLIDQATDDHGDAFECKVVTNRLGYQDDSTKRWSSIVIDSTDNSRSLAVKLEPGDEAATSATLLMTTSNDPTYGTTTWNESGKVYGGKRRWDRIDFRRTDRWATVEINQTSGKDKFEVTGIRAYYQPLGRR